MSVIVAFSGHAHFLILQPVDYVLILYPPKKHNCTLCISALNNEINSMVKCSWFHIQQFDIAREAVPDTSSQIDHLRQSFPGRISEINIKSL